MHDVIARQTWLIQSHGGLLQATYDYDVSNFNGGELLWEGREEPVNLLSRLLRFSQFQGWTPVDLIVRCPSGELLLRLRRPPAVAARAIIIYSGDNQLLGRCRRRMCLWGRRFDLVDPENRLVFQMRSGQRKDFQITADKKTLGRFCRHWRGWRTELFATADDYRLELADDVSDNVDLCRLLTAAALSADILLRR